MKISEDQAIHILNRVIEHLKDNAPKKTLTARKLIMDGILMFEQTKGSVH